MTNNTPTRDEAVLSVDALAQEIRRVDGSHSLGAGALAEALMPFLLAYAPAPAGGDVVAQALAMLDAESGDKLKTLWGVAAKSFADRIRALSQSTFTGKSK